MKKYYAFIVFLFVLLLVGCKKLEVEANLYRIDTDYSITEVNDHYTYQIIKDYQEYQECSEKDILKSFQEEYFDDHTLIIFTLTQGSSGMTYEIISTYKKGSTFTLYMRELPVLVQPILCMDTYCIEVESKGLKKFKLIR